MAALVVVAGVGVGLFLWFHRPETPQRGDYQTTVTAGAAGTPVSELARRLGWGSGEPVEPYDGSRQQLVVYVPPAYSPAKPAGLLVVVHLGAGQAPPTPNLKALLGRSNLILVSCNENGLSSPQ